MAGSSGDDIPVQLAALLGKTSVRIRKTDEMPPRVSVIDVISAITGKDARHSAEQLRRLLDQYPDVDSNCVHVKFLDARGRRGQKETPAACAKGIVEIIMLLQGRQAARVRRQAAELLCRYLGGDLSLVDEVCALRGIQEQLAVRSPDDPRRLFGAEVEASSSSSGGPWAHVLSTVNERLTKQEQILARIQASLEHDRQRVNLNVRAPKRAAANQPEVARNMSGVGRPFPVAKFLDTKEKEDPSWKSARRGVAPSFGTIVQVLKKNKLREEGKTAVYIEQNHRPQLLYTEEDRELMDEALVLTTAHREDLAGRRQPPPPAIQDRPSVIALLQRANELA